MTGNYYFAAKEAAKFSRLFACTMIKKIFLFAVTLLCFANLLSAQQVNSMMNIYNDRFSPEKIHVQTDRTIYKKGEPIFYKAYVLSNKALSVSSNTLYTDWYDDAGKLLKQDEAPILLAGAKGSFNVPPLYTGTALHLVCYTKWMLNFDTAFIYRRSINIHQINNNQASLNNKESTPLKTQVTFYPEGGFSVADL